jgi:tetrahydromethanopterin S-methyltransferase subunit F
MSKHEERNNTALIAFGIVSAVVLVIVLHLVGILPPG